MRNGKLLETNSDISFQLYNNYATNRCVIILHMYIDTKFNYVRTMTADSNNGNNKCCNVFQFVNFVYLYRKKVKINRF